MRVSLGTLQPAKDDTPRTQHSIDCCKRVGKDPHELQNENPFTKKGGVAQMIQMAASQFHPEQALAALEQQATEKRLRNRAVQFGGDLEQAQRSIDAEDQQQAQREQQRQLQAQQGRELEQRLEQQRINHARMVGGLL